MKMYSPPPLLSCSSSPHLLHSNITNGEKIHAKSKKKKLLVLSLLALQMLQLLWLLLPQKRPPPPPPTTVIVKSQEGYCCGHLIAELQPTLQGFESQNFTKSNPTAFSVLFFFSGSFHPSPCLHTHPTKKYGREVFDHFTELYSFISSFILTTLILKKKKYQAKWNAPLFLSLSFIPPYLISILILNFFNSNN